MKNITTLVNYEIKKRLQTLLFYLVTSTIINVIFNLPRPDMSMY